MEYSTEMEPEIENNYPGVPQCLNFNKTTGEKQAVKMAPHIFVL